VADNVLTAQNLHKAWGEKVLFGGLSFGIDRGQKVALLGLNGSGKSTLLRILAGRETDFEGAITRRSNFIHRYLDQAVKVVTANDPTLAPGDLIAGRTVAEEVFGPQGAIGILLARYVLVLHEMGSPEHAQLNERDADKAHEELSHLNDAIERDHGWDLYGQVQALAGQLDMDLAWRIETSLSGGQLKKIQLIRALAGTPDLLLLDEPTNHLDESAIRWLETKLATYPGTMIVVTHDRYFLENAVDHILELWNGDIRSFPGNYGQYLEKKAELEANLAVTEGKRMAFLKEEIHWIRRGPKARGTKAKARIQRFEDARDQKGYAADKIMDLDLDSAARLGKTILEITGLSKAYGDRQLFKDLELSLLPGDRIGILGPNGSGKTTFLKILLGKIKADAGELKLGVNTLTAYFDQKRESLDPEKTVWHTLGGDTEYVEFGGTKVPKRTFLENFLFPARMHFSKAGRLSGGEQNRLQLAMALVANPANLLILDEPTNDLDIATLQVLERALSDFPGCAIVVSHDRFFLDQVANSMLIFSKSGKVRQIQGNYSDYLESEAEDEKAAADAAAAAKVVVEQTKKQPGLSHQEKKEWESIEAKIAETEKAAEAAEIALAEASSAGKFAEVQEANQRYETLKKSVETLFARWEFLDSKRNGKI
jgi:ABC transport system ATP-binding/permease protein